MRDITDLGPPTRVVPVSIAAYEDDPDGREIELLLTLNAGEK
jgi:hypothetical protein